MKLLIKTVPDNWNDSQIVAQGLMRDGHQLNCTQTTIQAKDLPEPYLIVWAGIVETMRGNGLADGGRICVMGEASLEYDSRGVTDESGKVVENIEIAYVKLITHWQWEDGRMTDETANIYDQPVVDFVRYLLTEKTY